ncbi:MAG: energy-coupling factor ABC transporter ATP-binding protein [Oscillospiraceae bacterium]|jgi:energy-coupling factor transport system ATP-binding protein|nr:energy-coupling factor ABC transporter ATP-binding protein [Oscillospiraceae bacterium]
MIKINNLYSSYGSVETLKGVSLQIERGEFVALTGQNGAGKTTLLRHLNGLIKAPHGAVGVDGKDPAKCSVSDMAKSVGFLFQNPDHQIFSDTVEEEIGFSLAMTGADKETIKTRTLAVAEELGLLDKLTRNPFLLSKGERQRVALAGVLAAETPVLVLDEPTTGQDYLECMNVMSVVTRLNKEKGVTVIIVTHDMEIAADFAKRVVILCDGKILRDGDTFEVLRDTSSLEQAGLLPPQSVELSLLLGESFDKANDIDGLYAEICRQRGVTT